MKLKVITLVLLVLALGAILVVKNLPREETPDYTVATSSPAASLIEDAKQKGLPAWLLFQSST